MAALFFKLLCRDWQGDRLVTGRASARVAALLEPFDPEQLLAHRPRVVPWCPHSSAEPASKQASDALAFPVGNHLRFGTDFILR